MTIVASISPARKAAFRILLSVERGPGHSDDLLRGKAVNALSAQDRKLTTALVLGVLRWQIALDEQIRPLLTRPNAKLDPEILIALRMGAFQLLHLDRIPARAAIDESVELAKQAGHRFASGMVNAVLRKLSVSTVSEDSPGNDPSGLASSQSHPRWMVERWRRLYGPEAACTICEYGQAEPALVVRISGFGTEQELAREGVSLGPGALLRDARVVVRGEVTATKAFEEGRVRIQDEGSQLIGEIAVRAAADLDGRAAGIIDTCAAPGGKTLILAERIPAARIVACEASAPRLAQLQKRLAAFGDRIECRLADASALPDEAIFDLALSDVPCSGTGTLGRNPEIRHRLGEEDLPRQAERQSQILIAALRAVRPGGRVVYSTCSLEREENEQVIAAVLDASAHVRHVSLEVVIESMGRVGVLVPGAAERLRTCLTPELALRLLPGAFNTDGFFVALLERTA